MGRHRKVLEPSPDMSSFGIWLATYMHQSDLAVLDLVEQVPLSYSVIYSWIRGDTSPRILTLIEVCDLLSVHTGIRPFDLLSEAIVVFPEAVYAQKRWIKRNRSTQRNRNLIQGESLNAGIQADDERLYFIPLDKALEADKRAGDLTPDMTDAQSDAVEDTLQVDSVMKIEKGVTSTDHDFFALTTNKNCNRG